MKTKAIENQAGSASTGMRSKIITLIFILATILMTSSCATSAFIQGPGFGVSFAPPVWAPFYENVNQVRYYYLPDIESYYDVRNHEFVYMEDGNWIFSPSLPPQYAWYDLAAGFVVLLDYRVHQPWMHFHYYVSNYPRFYYQTVYRDSYNRGNYQPQGFNENTRSVVTRNSATNNSVRTNNGNAPTRINNDNNSTRMNSANSVSRSESPVRNSNGSVVGKSPARQAAGSNNSGQSKSAASPHPGQKMNYYGRHIGQRVRVTRKMSGPRGGRHRGR